jgi:hypothetical protein
MSNPYVGTKPADFADISKSIIPNTPGIFKGTVKSIDSDSRTGRLYVYLDGFGTDDAESPTAVHAVTYASPFMGTTTGKTIMQSGKIVAKNDFDNTVQTYGFYMTPPDIGNQVLCCFPGGLKEEGFWFACVNQNLSRRMLPGIGAVPLDRVEKLSIPAELQPLINTSFSYPVGEFHELSNVYNESWTSKALYPLHIPRTLQLINQGLDGDPIRGFTTSSVQRDPISNVFGFSTPGRPYKNDPAKMANVENMINSGNFNPADFKVTTRVGGHSLTMDDGDFLGKNNLVKMRSAAGHQLLMNDSEGVIYISNASGNTWIELTAKGDVLIYGAQDLAIRTQGSIQMHADKNIVMNAKGAIQMNAGGSFKIQSQDMSVNAGNMNLYGKSMVLHTGGTLSVKSGSSLALQAASGVSIKGKSINLNGGGPSASGAAPTAIKTFNLPDSIVINSAMGAKQWAARPDSFTSICSKVPTHEPYIRGNIAAVLAQEMAVNSTTTDVNGSTIMPEDGATPGLNSTIEEGVKRPAPDGAFISQPDPGQELGALNQDQLRAYMAQTGYTESGGKYDAVNQFGYQGKYQMGSSALQDLGYIKPGTPQTPEALNNPNNWTGKDGIGSAADFQNNSNVQESAMYNYTKNNYATLQSKGVIGTNTAPEDIAGLLSASHLVGAGAAAKWAKDGTSVSDANGTTAAQYFNQGKYSQTRVDTIVASNNGKTRQG